MVTNGRMSDAIVLALYILTLFISAALLFMLEPMFAKMALPIFGGSPTVWNVAVVFYQVALLTGYLYAHLLVKHFQTRDQVLIHTVFIIAPLFFLPIKVSNDWTLPAQTNPTLWLLALLLVTIGIPFCILSATNSLVQSWFAKTRLKSANDPYFLYAASNTGSMLALLGYPAFIEPNLGLRLTSHLWMDGYIMFIVTMVLCMATVWMKQLTSSRDGLGGKLPSCAMEEESEPLSLHRRIRWVLLAMVPSSLMLSVTTFLSTNIIPIPLFWVIPLAIYLLTFILVFARRQVISHHLVMKAMPIALIVLALTMVGQAIKPIEWLIGLHLLAFFILGMVCHGEIARDRPQKGFITEFYLWISLGGVLGGAFNALLAPMIFDDVIEYPLAIVLACVLMPRASTTPTEHVTPWLDLLLPVVLGASVAALLLLIQFLKVEPEPLLMGILLGLPLLVCYGFSGRPLRFGLGLAAYFLAGTLYESTVGGLKELHTERSFFGFHRIMSDPQDRYHLLVHGNTVHGKQSLDPTHNLEPLTYFYRNGPIGQLFNAFRSEFKSHKIAVIGLGAGSLACYSQPGQQWTIYEIDPYVKDIAQNTEYFSFLKECGGSNFQINLGDARLSLAEAPNQAYNIIILDAYTSDSIPSHLITREAISLYLSKLAPGGILAFHISNLYLNFKPILAGLAQDADLHVRIQEDLSPLKEDSNQGKSGSVWGIMVRDPKDFGPLAADYRWKEETDTRNIPVWTDDFSSIFAISKWQME